MRAISWWIRARKVGGRGDDDLAQNDIIVDAGDSAVAAREVAVSALGTVYAMSGSRDVAGALTPVIAQGWSVATGLSLLAWYVFAPQCLSTLAVVRRETNSWRYPVYMATYLLALAYLGALLTYHVALLLGGGVAGAGT